MTDDLFDRDKPTPECLSHLALSRHALNQLAAPEAERAQVHLESCARCRRLVELEVERVEASTSEQVPAAVLEASSIDQRTSALPWFRLSLIAAAAMLAIIVAVLVSPSPQPAGEPGLRTKGVLDLEATLRRDGRIIETAVPLGTVSGLQAGDELRLRALGAAGSHAALQACEQGSCEILFRGQAPGDGWLPTGLTATTGAAILRLTVCASQPALDESLRGGEAAGCRKREWKLDVSP